MLKVGFFHRFMKNSQYNDQDSNATTGKINEHLQKHQA
jgi:hypothetical protein